MPGHVPGHEAALRYHPQPARPGVIKRVFREFARDPASFEGLRDASCVVDGSLTVADILEDRHLTFDTDFEAGCGRVVDDGRAGSGIWQATPSMAMDGGYQVQFAGTRPAEPDFAANWPDFGAATRPRALAECPDDQCNSSRSHSHRPEEVAAGGWQTELPVLHRWAMNLGACAFCQIANGVSACHAVYDGPRVLAFLDRGPIRPGHTQIIPRAHYPYFDDLPPALLAEISAIGQAVAKVLKQVHGVERVAFAFTGGDVAHAHAHVVPLFEKTDITSRRYIQEPSVTFRALPRAPEADQLEMARRLCDGLNSVFGAEP